VRIELQFRDQGLGVFSGTITVMDGAAMDRVLVEATVNVYQPDAAGGKNKT
jgi:hypothetical protein